MLDLPAITHGFTSGLGLMNDAMQLGASAPEHLRRPTFKPLKPTKSRETPKVAVPLPRAAPEEEEFTFRTLAEDYAAQRDLVFVPLGKSHAETGKPLFRVAKGVDGKGGVTVYVGDDAVFALVEDGSYRAVTLDDMARRAGA
jgi:tuftelin-interacting protein 11